MRSAGDARATALFITRILRIPGMRAVRRRRYRRTKDAVVAARELGRPGRKDNLMLPGYLHSDGAAGLSVSHQGGQL
jgi:hypothetical protein